MGIFKKRYNLEDDIAQTREQLKRIEMLGDMTKHPAWKDVDALFRKIIGTYADQMLALCDDPQKNSFEIRCKHMVVQALTALLATIDGKVKSGEQLRHSLENKVLDKENMNKPVI